MPERYDLGPVGVCVGTNVCPLIAVGPPSPNMDNLQDLPECIRNMFPRSATPADIIQAVWSHLKQCPLVRVHIDHAQNTDTVEESDMVMTSTSGELVKVWNEVNNTKKRSDRWEATLSVEAEQWNILASQFVDLTRQTLLGAVKSLPIEFRKHDLRGIQESLQNRRRNALEMRDDLVRRTQRINKQHQVNEESRRLLLHYVTNEVNAKLEEAHETQNLIDRHHYVARATNKAKQDQMNKPKSLATRELEQKNERLKLLALDPQVHKLGSRYLQEDDLPTININYVNKFDTKAVASRMQEQMMERNQVPEPTQSEAPEEGSIALDFFTGGFWLKKDNYRSPQHERDVDYEDRKWKLAVGERETSDPRGSDQKSQWIRKLKKPPRRSGDPRRRVDPQIEYSRIHNNIEEVRDELAHCLNRPELGEAYAAYDPSDYLPVADIVRKEAERVEAEKIERATQRAKAEKRKRRAEEKQRVPPSRHRKPIAPNFPVSWLVPAGPSAPPREYKRVVEDLNTIDTCGALTGAHFIDYIPQDIKKLADSYI